MTHAPSLNNQVLEKLRAINPQLFLVWDCINDYWVIFERHLDGQVFHVGDVKDANGKYMPIDERTFISLRKGDNSKYRNAYEATVRMKTKREKVLKSQDIEREDAAKNFAKRVAWHARGNRYFVMGKGQ
jgi:hypothetical protein